MTTKIAGGRYEFDLPLNPAQEQLASPDERFQIALRMVDAIERRDAELSYAELRKRVMKHTGLSWAPAALAIQYRREQPLPSDA